MTTSVLIRSNPIFADIDGTALENGYLYIGTANTNPEITTNQLQVYYDSALTIPAAQPIRTINGYPARSGSPAKIYVSSAADYSLTVRNAQRSLVYANSTSSDFVISNNSISTTMIQDLAVTTAKLADGSVTTVKIADLNVTTGKLAASAVTTAKIADSNVTTAKIADSNVTTAKIADSNVTTAKIADLNVTTDKLAASAVTTAKIADDNVSPAKIKGPTAGNTNEIARFVASGSAEFTTNSTATPSNEMRFTGGCEQNDLKRIGFMILAAGVIRVKYTQINSGGGNDVQSKIIKNGTTQYSFTTTSGNTNNRSEDITVAVGDCVQIMHWSDNVLTFSTLSDVRITSDVNSAAIG